MQGRQCHSWLPAFDACVEHCRYDTVKLEWSDAMQYDTVLYLMGIEIIGTKQVAIVQTWVSQWWAGCPMNHWT
ncbi:MAG: hypothetical protein ACKPKO_52690, partial [Candidatus Fonsibacter sp.]